MHFVVGTLDNYAVGDGDVRLFHVDGTLVHTFKGHYVDHDNDMRAVAVTADGQHIISGSMDSLVRVWSVATKSLVSTCEGHTGPVYAVAAMPDGQRILSGGNDNTVRVWLLNGTLQNTFRLHTNYVLGIPSPNTGIVWTVVAMPDNRHALSGSKDTTVKLFNVNDGVVLRTIRHHTDNVLCLALLPDGLRFVSGSTDKTARIAYHGLAPQ